MKQSTNLSIVVPNSIKKSIKEIAEERGVSTSQVAREVLVDGMGLRTGETYRLPNGYVNIVGQLEKVKQKQYLIFYLLVVIIFLVYLNRVL